MQTQDLFHSSVAAPSLAIHHDHQHLGGSFFLEELDQDLRSSAFTVGLPVNNSSTTKWTAPSFGRALYTDYTNARYTDYTNARYTDYTNARYTAVLTDTLQTQPVDTLQTQPAVQHTEHYYPTHQHNEQQCQAQQALVQPLSHTLWPTSSSESLCLASSDSYEYETKATPRHGEAAVRQAGAARRSPDVPGAGGKAESSRRKKKSTYMDGGPKKPATSFVLFSNTVRQQVKAANPGISFTELGRKLGEYWRFMDPATRKSYEDKAAADIEKYLAEKKAWLVAKYTRGASPVRSGCAAY